MLLMVKVDEDLILLLINLTKATIKKINKLDKHIRHSNNRLEKLEISKALKNETPDN